MIKRDIAPILGAVMAVVALPGPVTGRSGVAARTGSIGAVMGENNRIPICGDMAFRTIGLVVVIIAWWLVAVTAIIVAVMTELNIRPGGSGVALVAEVAIVIRRGFTGMALHTLSESGVIKIVV